MIEVSGWVNYLGKFSSRSAVIFLPKQKETQDPGPSFRITTPTRKAHNAGYLNNYSFILTTRGTLLQKLRMPSFQTYTTVQQQYTFDSPFGEENALRC